MHALNVHDVRLTYPATRKTKEVQALTGIDLNVDAGQSIALLGPNGSGKSTLLRIICGITPADAGEVQVFGEQDRQTIRWMISVVFQSNGLDPHLTVEENLRCQARLYGIDRDEADEIINAELERAGLIDRRRTLVKALSLGLARRVDLVRAMLHSPKLLLLDEPTVGLDPVARSRFLDEVERRRREHGVTVLMSTHLIDEADQCDRCVFIHHGRIVADDEPAALRRRMGGLMVTVHGAAEIPIDAQKSEADVAAIHWQRIGGGWRTHMPTEDGDRDTNGALKRIAAILAHEGRAFTVAPPTLAGVFADLTGASLNDETGETITKGN